MSSWHSARSCGPAAAWMTLSMHMWSGWKHPRMPEFAALTMQSTLSAVMSPRHTAIFPAAVAASAWEAHCTASTTVFWLSSRCRIASMSASTSAGSGPSHGDR